MTDQPRPEAKPTREHRLLAFRMLRDSRHVDWGVQAWIETGVTAQQSTGFFVIGQDLIKNAALLASRDAEAEERGRLLEREAVIRFLNAQPTGVSLPSCAQAIGSEVHLATPAAPETKT